MSLWSTLRIVHSVRGEAQPYLSYVTSIFTCTHIDSPWLLLSHMYFSLARLSMGIFISFFFNLPTLSFEQDIKPSPFINSLRFTLIKITSFLCVFNSWGLPVRIPSQPAPIPSAPSPSSLATSPPPDNPWQSLAAASPPVGATASSVSFTEIVQDQLDQKMYLEKAAQKPLHLIQVGAVSKKKSL